MANGDEGSGRSPFTKPGFIAGGLVVALIVVLGVVIGIVNMTNEDPDTDPTASTSSGPDTDPPASEEPTEADAEASVCGLDGAVAESARLTEAPDVDEWAYQGTSAYPVSSQFGPAETDQEGIRYCFQHSPEGVVFAAGNALVQGTDPASTEAWFERFLADGPYRDRILEEAAASSDSPSAGIRLSIAGFRLLNYDGATARVDIAVNGSADGQSIVGSYVYELVWQNGDWQLSADTQRPFEFATIPDLSGYIAWEE